MATVKVTTLFQATTDSRRVAGWSETWYFDGTLDAAFDAVKNLAKKRGMFLTAGAAMIGFRCQVLGERAQIFKQVNPGQCGDSTDIPQMALTCSCLAAGLTNQKSFIVRGIPDGNVVGGAFQPSPAFTAGFTQWSAGIAGRFRFKALNLAATKAKVVTIGADGTFSFAEPLAYNVGDTIQIIRAKNINGNNASGFFYVSAKTDAQNGKFLNYAKGIVSLSGLARVRSYVYPTITPGSIQFGQVTTRKVGRPFDLYHGRATRR
jgi:hypothetical protein